MALTHLRPEHTSRIHLAASSNKKACILPGSIFLTKEIENIERSVLSIGTSLALVPITGLLLNYTAWGIKVTPVTLSLLALTIILATIALIREQEAKLKPTSSTKREYTRR